MDLRIGNTSTTLIPGPRGAEGYTPAKGVDYWTEEDVETIVEDVVNAVLDSHVVEDGLVTRELAGEYTNSRVTSVGQRAFDHCKNLTAVNFPLVTTIGSDAFKNCTGLTEVDFPLVTSIGNEAFVYCTGLTEVDFPLATYIGSYAFEYCTKLITVKFPQVKSVSKYAFAHAKQLVTIDFSHVQSIAQYTFYNCPQLQTLIIRNTDKVCTLNSEGTFRYSLIASGEGYIYVPDDLVDSYKAATNWANYADQIKPLSELEE